jgi:hypothetical protein
MPCGRLCFGRQRGTQDAAGLGRHRHPALCGTDAQKFPHGQINVTNGFRGTIYGMRYMAF